MTEALPLLKVNYLIITYPARPLLIRLLQSIPITFMTEDKKFKDTHTLILEFSLKLSLILKYFLVRSEFGYNQNPTLYVA